MMTKRDRTSRPLAPEAVLTERVGVDVIIYASADIKRGTRRIEHNSAIRVRNLNDLLFGRRIRGNVIHKDELRRVSGDAITRRRIQLVVAAGQNQEGFAVRSRCASHVLAR